MYTVTRTIKDREYTYEQESYRDENGNPRTRYKYLGPVDGGVRRKKGVLGEIGSLLNDAMRSKREWELKPETEEEILARVARETVEHAARDRVNAILSGPTITLEGMREVAAHQAAEAERAMETATPRGKESFFVDAPVDQDREFIEPASEPPAPDTPSSEPAQPSGQTPSAGQE